MSLVATNEISVDAAVTALSSELDGIFMFKEEQRTTLKALLSGKDVFALLTTGGSVGLFEYSSS